MQKQNSQISPPDAEELAIRALGFMAGDEKILSRFMAITGWSPETMNAPQSRDALLATVLEHLMSEEDLLLAFAANAGIDPANIPWASQALTKSDSEY